jgi:hypothetical protein
MARADFRVATFSGNAGFSDATFDGDAWFGGATFTRLAWFRGATFTGRAWFSGGTTFGGSAVFIDATFGGHGEPQLSFAGSHVLKPTLYMSGRPAGWRLGPDGSGGYTVVRANDAGQS